MSTFAAALRISTCISTFVAVTVIGIRYINLMTGLHMGLLYIQLFNVFILFIGLYRKIFKDPIYYIWIGYGFTDFWNIAVMMIRYGHSKHLPEEFYRKWAAYLGVAFGWSPSLAYQLFLSMYCLGIVSAPLWYFGAKDKPKFRRIVKAVVLGIPAISALMRTPMLVDGYNVDLRLNSSQYADEKHPDAESLYSFYRNSNNMLMPLTLLFYVCVGLNQKFRSSTKKDHRKVVRLILPPMLSGLVTAVNSLSADFGGSSVFLGIVSDVTYPLNYMSNVAIQLVRNSDYRYIVRNLFGMSTKIKSTSSAAASSKQQSKF